MKLEQEIKEIKEKLDQLLTPRGTIPGQNNLLNTSQVLDELGIKATDRAWPVYRQILMEQYGMKKIPGAGRRIRRANLEKFLQENYI